VHLVVDAIGLPADFEITEGQRHDLVPAPELVQRCKPRCLLADRAYDSDAIRAQLQALQCEAVIPPKSNRVAVLSWDHERYKERSAVECAFNRLKQARRFATRYEKTLRNYSAVVAIGCAVLWLRDLAVS
jgi:transposase